MTKKLSIWALVVAGILMIPFLTRAPWSGGDYAFSGIVLFAVAAIYEFTTKNMTKPTHKLAVAAGVLITIGLILAWAATGPD